MSWTRSERSRSPDRGARVACYETGMDPRDATEVARRTLCLELLLQRLGLETDDEDPIADREKIRALWATRLTELGIDADVLPVERAFLERPVGGLTEDDLDDVHGRATGALALLWVLGRLETKPNAASVEEIADLLGDHGLLGDGSITRAKEAVAAAKMRDLPAVEEARTTYERARGKAKEPTEPEKIFAGIGAHHLAWVLDRAMPFDE